MQRPCKRSLPSSRRLWRTYLLVVLLASATSACATERGGVRGQSVRGQGTDEVAIAATPDALIQMRRSGCVDRPCPVYGVSIFLDGTVVYDGVANVGAIGQRTWKVSPDKVSQLVSSIEAMGFLDTPTGAGVCRAATQTAIVILDYRPGCTEKTVLHDDRCPSALPALMTLENAIDRLSGAEQLATQRASSAIALTHARVR